MTIKIPLLFGLTSLLVSLACANREIIVNLEKQTLEAKENGHIVIKGSISSGKRGYETVAGDYKITQKEVDHKSTLYPKPSGGAKMPYMMRLGWTAMALHLGNLPGYPASHGCVRVERGIIKKLYSWTKRGTVVHVIGKTSHRKKFKVVSAYAPSRNTSSIPRPLEDIEANDEQNSILMGTVSVILTDKGGRFGKIMVSDSSSEDDFTFIDKRKSNKHSKRKSHGKSKEYGFLMTY